jgi:2-hydroxy-6-oxonona-2,4-dienedioate hydrolase
MDVARYRAAEQRLWAENGAVPKERFVRLSRNGVRVRVLEVGEGPPVLFVHGSPSAASTWAPLAARLSGMRCLLVDRPGTGLSDPYRYDHASLRRILDTLVVDVLDALELESAHMVGSSLGSDFVLVACGRHPDRVLRSVHFSCPGGAPGIHVPFYQRVLALPVVWRLATLLPANRKGMAAMMRSLGHQDSLDAGRISEAKLDWFASLYRDTPTLYHEAQGAPYMVTLRGMHPSLVFTAEELAAVRSPTLFLWGGADSFGDESVGQELVDLMADARMEVLPKGGHLVWLDDPDRAASATQAHLLEDAAHMARA